MPSKRRSDESEKDGPTDRRDEPIPAKGDPTDGSARKASLTDRLASADSPIGRRGYLGLLGATASLAAVPAVRSAPATTVNLGDEGLTDGDRIDPYIDEHLQNDVQVVVPQGSYDWDGSGLHGKTFSTDAELVGDGQVTLNRVSLPNHTDVESNGGTFRMQNFTFRGDAGGGSASDDTRIRAECGSSGTIEFVNVRHPDGTRQQSESEATAWYVPGAHGGTIRFINCEACWWGNNAIYASSPGHGNQGTVEVIGGFFHNNNIASIRIGGDDWLIKDACIVHDERAPSRIDSGTRMRGIRIDEGGQNGRIENVHISVFDSVGVASPPLENSDDSAGGSCTVQDFYIYNETGEDCIDLARASYDMSGDNVQLTGGGNMDYDGSFSNVCVGDSCQVPTTEEIDGDGSPDSSDGGTDTSDWSVVEVLSTNDATEFDYEFDTDGSVALDLAAGANSAETGNDTVADNGDGTYTVSGHTGFGEGDTFRVDGTLTDFRTAAATGDFAVHVDGDQLDVEGGSGDQDANAEEAVVEVLSTNDATEFDYEFDADGPVARVGNAGDRSAETSNDDVVDNGDGTYTVSGHTGFGMGDTFTVEGTLTDFRTAAATGDFAVHVDGDQLDVEGGSGDQDANAEEAVVEVLSTDDATEFDYTLETSGPVTRVTDAGDRSAETGNDSITDNGDGTYTVSGHTGFGLGDTFAVEGDLVAFRPDATPGQCAVHVDGTDVTSDYLLPNRIVIDGTDNGPSQYSFEVTGEVAPAPGSGPLEAEDTLSGSAVQGEVSGDVDAYFYSGDVVSYNLQGAATVVIEDRDG